HGWKWTGCNAQGCRTGRARHGMAGAAKPQMAHDGKASTTKRPRAGGHGKEGAPRVRITTRQSRDWVRPARRNKPCGGKPP
ncbi:MAG: hypothetical protein WCR59_04600, partial [Planctomycetota bacterium]